MHAAAAGSRRAAIYIGITLQFSRGVCYILRSNERFNSNY